MTEARVTVEALVHALVHALGLTVASILSPVESGLLGGKNLLLLRL